MPLTHVTRERKTNVFTGPVENGDCFLPDREPSILLWHKTEMLSVCWLNTEVASAFLEAVGYIKNFKGLLLLFNIPMCDL